MPTALHSPSAFPTLTSDSILSFQFSSWYPLFSNISIRSTVIRPLSKDFRDYLDSDGVFVPHGSEDAPAESTLSEDEAEVDSDSDSDESDDYGHRHYSFPELDDQIRKVITEYGAVFPKLNFSSPRDAAWVLPASSPLRCTSPADVYLLLKSSDFISHDLNPDLVFEHCEVSSPDPSLPNSTPYELELVLRKWYPINRGREFRCFVRQEVFLGISQRDPNYYPFLNENDMEQRVTQAILQLWEDNIKGKWGSTQGNYVFDVLLTRDSSRGHVLDFNPYAPQTDPLLFSYDELLHILENKTRNSNSNHAPVFKVIDSPGHPAASSNAPLYQHNMIPFEALSLSSGRDIEEFAELWKDEIESSLK